MSSTHTLVDAGKQKECPESHYPGVTWDKKSRKWRGTYQDKLECTASGGRKLVNTPYFAKHDDCIEAYEALKKRIDDKFWAQVIAWKEDGRKFEGVPLGPDDASQAGVNTVYWRPNIHDGNEPHLVVRKNNGKQRVSWIAACQHRGCTHVAVPPKGGKAIHCLAHHGGCPHKYNWVNCRECNPKATEMMGNCSSCAAHIDKKRRRSNNGCGLCLDCENHQAAEQAAEAAAAAGEEAPAPPAKKVKVTKAEEIKMLQCLVNAGYVQSRYGGRSPPPGEFTREVYIDNRCALASEFKTGEKKFAYVDFVVCPKKGGCLVFLEVDEGEHKGSGYTVSCDSTRMWNAAGATTLDLSGDKNILWLRVNPDTKFSIGNKNHSPSNTTRCDAVCRFLDTFEGKPNDPPMRIAYAFYQMEADCTAKRTRDPDYPPIVLSAVLRLEHQIDADGAVCLLLD